MSTIGQRLKKIRSELRLSQESFGKKLKMSKSGISAVENDKVFLSVEALRTLFFDLDINLNFLVVGEGNMFNKKTSQFEQVKGELLKEVRQMLKDEGIIK